LTYRLLGTPFEHFQRICPRIIDFYLPTLAKGVWHEKNGAEQEKNWKIKTFIARPKVDQNI